MNIYFSKQQIISCKEEPLKKGKKSLFKEIPEFQLFKEESFMKT